MPERSDKPESIFERDLEAEFGPMKPAPDPLPKPSRLCWIRHRRRWLLAGGALFGAALLLWVVMVLVSFMSIRSAVHDVKKLHFKGPEQVKRLAKVHIEDLGGPERTAGLLALYVRMPRRLAPHKGFAVAMMSQCGAYAVPYLKECLADEYWAIRWEAVNSLGLIGDADGVDAVIPLLQDDNPSIRAKAIQALGANKKATYFRHFVAMLKDEDEHVQTLAISALIALRDSRSTPYLRGMLASPRPAIRWASARALGMFGDREAVESLTTMLNNDRDQKVRDMALRAIVGIGDPKSRDIIEGALKHESAAVRKRAAESLERIKNAEGKVRK